MDHYINTICLAAFEFYFSFGCGIELDALEFVKTAAILPAIGKTGEVGQAENCKKKCDRYHK